MFSYIIGEYKPVIFTYPDVPSELNKFGKCLTTEISGMPYFSQQKTFLSNHVDHLHNRERCLSQANDCQSKLKTKHTPGKAKTYEASFNSFCVLLENKAKQLC